MENTNQNGAEPGELNILSQINAVLAKWRMLLVFGLILAVLAGAYNYRKQAAAVRSWKAPEAKAGDESGDAAMNVPNYSLVREKVLNAINDKIDFFENSYQSRINPAKVSKATADIYVSTDAMMSAPTVYDPAASDAGAYGEGIPAMTAEVRSAAQILDHYCLYGAGSADYSGLAEKFGTEEQYIRELVTFGSKDFELMRATVTVNFTDEEGAEEILDCVLSQLKDHKADVDADFGEHDLIIRNKTLRTVVDNGPISTVIQNRTTELNTLMKQYNDLKTNEGNLDVKIIETATERPVLSKAGVIRMAVAGFIGGVILYAALYLLYLALSSKVLTARDLNDYYGFRKLSVIPDPKLLAKKGIDRMIASDALRYASNKDPEKCLEILEGNLKAVRPDVTKVAIVSDLGKDALEVLAEKLRAAGSTIRYEVLGELTEPADLRTVEECDGVIVAARTMESRYNRLNDLIRSLKDSGRTIFGSLVF